jgi:hypothetical protein
MPWLNDNGLARVCSVSTAENSYFVPAFKYCVGTSAVLTIKTTRLFPSVLGYIQHLFSALEF